MEVDDPKFPYTRVPYEPAGPYAMDESVLTSEQYVIWTRSCQAFAVAHRMTGWDRLYYDFSIRHPALLVHRGWGCIVLYAEPDGLVLLREAQALVGRGRDKQFDRHVDLIDLIDAHVKRLLRDNDAAWNQLDDPENQTWLRKWTPLRAMPEGVEITPEINILLETVLREWNELKVLLPPKEAVLRYDRLLSLQTNELEGLFCLHDKSVSRLVRIGFFPAAVVLLKEGSLDFETLDEAQPKVAQVCEGVSKAIKVVTLQSEGKIPVDTASIKQLHFECTFHSRFTIVDRPATYGITFPGTFRQAVCSTTYLADGKIGVVQYCHFREVPSEVEKMLSLFNQYLSESDLPASPFFALKVAAWCHTWFSSIHPFGDGNGRVGRLLSSIPLLRCGLPPVNIMGYPTTKTSKKEYVDALMKAQFNDEILPLMTVILNGMLESLSYLRQNCIEEEPGDKGCKHGGQDGRTKMRFGLRLRVPTRRVNT